MKFGILTTPVWGRETGRPNRVAGAESRPPQLRAWAVLAAGTLWLYFTNPVPVVNAVNEGDVTPFVRDLAHVLLDALQGLLKYL